MPQVESGRRFDGLVVTCETPWPPGVVRALSTLAAQGMAVGVVRSANSGTTAPKGVSLYPSRDVALEALTGRGVPVEAIAVVEARADCDGLRRLLADQVRRRRRRELLGTNDVDPAWCVVFDGFDPDLERTREVLATLADGRIGVGGATLARHPGQRRWAVASGVYDGEGPAEHLLPGPVGLHLPYDLEPGARLRRVLDLRTGLVSEEAGCDAGLVRSVRFSSLARRGLNVMRAVCPDGRTGPLLQPSTNGAAAEEGADSDVTWMRAVSSPPAGGIVAAAQEVRAANGNGHVLDRVVAYETDGAAAPAPDTAVRRAREAAAVGFDRLLAEHRQAWADRWADADISIEGDDALQLATRFALFHLMASVPEEGEAPVGARGLTGEGYRGHVFWDADTFTLPFLAATRPAAARAMLEYRVRRLPAARDIARACGRAGARFPWESARSGFDVTPTSARDRTGKLIRIRTGQLEEHIVAQVPWAACHYVEWTGDEEFARGAGLRLLVETARYWRSRVRLQRDGTVHIDRVIGPDEYHDPVDDNAFTNVMARWNLRKAADAVEAAPDAASDVGTNEIGRWRRIADAIVDGFDPDTGVYEQFKGFHGLEPLLIEEVAPRRPIAADLLLGTHRVRRAQVVKQADVLMLHHLVPDEVAPGTLDPNLRYYEPRTAHGSSLSPPVHASLFARAQDYAPALDALRIAADMDRDDLTQSTAIGLHFATMGGLWQALAYGFAGLQARDDGLHIDPHLPPGWDGLALRVRYRGSRVRVRCEQARITVHADPSAAVVVSSSRHTAGPTGLRLVRRGTAWEVAP